MSWIEVCKEVVGQDRQDVQVAAQTYYGRLLAVNGVCELVTSQLVGVVSDKHGRRPVQVAAQLGQVPWNFQSQERIIMLTSSCQSTASKTAISKFAITGSWSSCYTSAPR